MEILAIITIIVGILELFFGFFILIKRQKSEITIYFSLLIFSVAVWVLSNGIYRFFMESYEVMQIMAKLAYVGAILLVIFFLKFTFVFPFRDKRFGAQKTWWLAIPIIFFFPFLFFDRIFVGPFNIPDGTFIIGPIYYVFAVFMASFFAWSIYVLFDKYKKSDGIHRWQLKYLLIGSIISILLGVTFNLFIRMFVSSWNINHVGPLLSFFWLGFTSYIVWKR